MTWSSVRCELGLSGLAVTDHQGLYGAVRFTAAAREAGLHAIVGMEVELLDAAAPDPGRHRCAGSSPASSRGCTSASAWSGQGSRCGRWSSANDHRDIESLVAKTYAACVLASWAHT